PVREGWRPAVGGNLMGANSGLTRRITGGLACEVGQPDSRVAPVVAGAALPRVPQGAVPSPVPRPQRPDRPARLAPVRSLRPAEQALISRFQPAEQALMPGLQPAEQAVMLLLRLQSEAQDSRPRDPLAGLPLTPECPRRVPSLAPRRSLAGRGPVPPVLFPLRAAVRWIHPPGPAPEPPVRPAPGPGAAGPAVVPWSPPHPAGGLASSLKRRLARILPPGQP